MIPPKIQSHLIPGITVPSPLGGILPRQFAPRATFQGLSVASRPRPKATSCLTRNRTMKTGIAALTLALLATSASAAEFVHKASGLKFELPEGWSCKEKKGRLEIDNEDKTVAVVGGVIPKESAKAIFADIKKFLDSLDGFDDIEITGGPEKETVNGLKQ